MACQFPNFGRGAFGFQGTASAIRLFRPVLKNTALINMACRGENFPVGTDIEITPLVEGKVTAGICPVRYLAE